MPCDTAKTTNSDQCNRCFREWLGSDDESLWLDPCHGCRLKHLRSNMIEKIDGYYCASCAVEYEDNLLKQMTGGA